ncbi:hypothetical protein VPHK251G3_0027 [Vibrio phage K251 g3]
MSLKQITATNVDDLISKLEQAALAAGWNSASNGVFKARAGDARTFNISKYTYRSKDYVRLALDNSVNDMQRAMAGPMVTYYRTWFKIEISPVPYIVVIVEQEPSSLYFFSFGYLESVNGSVSEDCYISGQGYPSSYTQVKGSIVDAGGLLADYKMTSSDDYPGGVYSNGSFYSSGGDRDTDVYNMSGGGIPSHRIAALLLCGNNTIGSTQLITKPLIWGSKIGETVRTPLGYLPIHAISMEFLTSGQKVQLAGTDYVAFSLGKKSYSSDPAYPYVNGTTYFYWGFALEDN